MEMMEKFESMWHGHLGWATVIKNRFVLDLQDAPHIHSALYCECLEQQELKREGLNKLREAGAAVPALTEWALLNICVSKKDGGFFVVDCRRLSFVTERDSYSIPKKNESIDMLREAQIFLTLNANSECQKIEMNEKDVDKTVIVTQRKIFKNMRVPLN